MKKIISQIIPLSKKNIDTDMIIPGEFLTRIDKGGYGKHLFARLKKLEPAFPFNLKSYAKREILVALENFGCGSSREHAVWALKDWGIRVIIAPSFGDIFYANAFKNFLLPIVMEKSIVERLIKQDQTVFTVDLDGQMIFTQNESYSFDIDAYRKNCLIKEIDDLEYLLGSIEKIKKFEADHSSNIFLDLSEL